MRTRSCSNCSNPVHLYFSLVPGVKQISDILVWFRCRSAVSLVNLSIKQHTRCKLWTSLKTVVQENKHIFLKALGDTVSLELGQSYWTLLQAAAHQSKCLPLVRKLRTTRLPSAISQNGPTQFRSILCQNFQNVLLNKVECIRERL